MTKSTGKVTGRLQTDDGVTVLTRSVRVTDYRESVRVTAVGELVRVEVGYLDQPHFSTPYHALQVDADQAEHLAAVLIAAAKAARNPLAAGDEPPTTYAEAFRRYRALAMITADEVDQLIREYHPELCSSPPQPRPALD